MTKYIVAIDPGKSGGVACNFPDGSVLAYPCPDTFPEVFDILADTITLLRAQTQDANILGVLEKVHAMPGQGVTSMFTFGMGYGAWLMAFIALKIPFVEVTPQSWMKKFGALPKEKKDRKIAIKDRMQKKYPTLKVTLSIADALAIMDVSKEG